MIPNRPKTLPIANKKIVLGQLLSRLGTVCVKNLFLKIRETSQRHNRRFLDGKLIRVLFCFQNYSRESLSSLRSTPPPHHSTLQRHTKANKSHLLPRSVILVLKFPISNPITDSPADISLIYCNKLIESSLAVNIFTITGSPSKDGVSLSARRLSKQTGQIYMSCVKLHQYEDSSWVWFIQLCENSVVTIVGLPFVENYSIFG